MTRVSDDGVREVERERGRGLVVEIELVSVGIVIGGEGGRCGDGGDSREDMIAGSETATR